ncbi:MAG TPA: aminotransferase class V-fold PLP-dependent enzyme [Bacteroidia bacterium]|nr:aminotransferase class V-fold PLP-dependent enzyme [Bacteroidia bacterium]
MIHYLNNAGAGLMSDDTINTITNYLHLEKKIGAYQAAKSSKNEIDTFYKTVVSLINASSTDEIAFMDSASRAWNMLIYGLDINEGDKIITLSSEFGTNLITLFDKASKVNAKVKVISCANDGSFSMKSLEEYLKDGAKVIALSHVAAHGSIVNPVKEIGVLAKKYGATYIVDGCQALGQIAVDVQDIKCDAYLTTGRKWLCGPRGTAFLYVKSSSFFNATQLDLASADLILDNNRNVLTVKIISTARKFELWERSISNMLGFSSAIQQYMMKDKQAISEKIKVHADKLRLSISKNTNLNLIGKIKSTSGIVGFYLKNPIHEKNALDIFFKQSIEISTMSDWDCPLHFSKENGESIIFRLSPHYYTDDSTIETTINILDNL